MNSSRWTEDFENLSISELKYLLKITKESFNKQLNTKAYLNELYNDDGEYNLIQWLKDL
jgi:hypothetical protein